MNPGVDSACFLNFSIETRLKIKYDTKVSHFPNFAAFVSNVLCPYTMAAALSPVNPVMNAARAKARAKRLAMSQATASADTDQ